MTEGWAAIPNWLVRHEGVTPNMIAVYAVIQSHAGSKGTTRLLLQTIADEAGMSYSSAQRAAKSLNALGVLWWEAQGSATKRTASIYHPLQEADPARVEQAHKPASRRQPVRSQGPSGTVTGTVLTQVNPQDSAVPDEPVRSEGTVGTVTAVRSQGPYVRSQGPREEEPSKKNPLPSTYSSPPPPGVSIAKPPAPLSWYPSAEVVEGAKDTYTWLTPVKMREITLRLITNQKKKGEKPSDALWLAYLRTENRDQEKVVRDEAAAREPKKDAWFAVAGD